MRISKLRSISFLCSLLLFISCNTQPTQSNNRTDKKTILTKTTDSTEDKSNIPEGWMLLEMGEMGSIAIPPTLEFRENDSRSKSFQKVMDDFYKINFDMDSRRDIVFQPKGYEADPRSISTYARVIVNYEKGRSDDYLRWNDNIEMSKSEYNELNKAFKDMLLYQVKQANKIGREVKINDIMDLKVGKNSAKFVYLLQEYTRTGLEGNVKVLNYRIHNNDEMVELILSYRLSEQEIWASDFSRIINTFSFKTKKR